MQERTVIHLFTDSTGNIVDEQVMFGLDEVVETYDYSSVESEEELLSRGLDKLKEEWKKDSVDVDIDDSIRFDVGDIVEAIENVTGVKIKTPITKKIVKLENGIITINYKVGD